ncbi:MAG TPA: hypothetical protein VM009_02905 [Terriglobales bacterium]|nr:hypothetical protein [Terriglobales bacterium]
MADIEGALRFYLGLASLGAMAIVSFLIVFVSLRGIKRSWQQAVTESKQFADRKSLTLDEFYAQFYADENMPRTAVLETVSRFAAAAHVSAQILKPDDTFQTVGAQQRHAEDCERFVVDTAMLLRAAEERYGITLFSGQLITLDDYIRVNVLAARLTSKTTAVAKTSS